MNDNIKYNKNNEYEKRLQNEKEGFVLELWNDDDIGRDVCFYKGFANERYVSKKCITDIEVQILKRLREVSESKEILEKCVPIREDNKNGDDSEQKKKVKRFLNRRARTRTNSRIKTNSHVEHVKMIIEQDERENEGKEEGRKGFRNGRPMLKKSITNPNMIFNKGFGFKRKETKHDTLNKYDKFKAGMEIISESEQAFPLLKDSPKIRFKENKVYNTVATTSANSNNISLSRNNSTSNNCNSNYNFRTHIHKQKQFHKGSLLLLAHNHSFLEKNNLIQTSLPNNNSKTRNSCSILYATPKQNKNDKHLSSSTLSHNSSNKLMLYNTNKENSFHSYIETETSKSNDTIHNPIQHINKYKKRKLKGIPLPKKNLNNKINKTLNKSLLIHKNILSKSNSYSYYTSHKLFVDNHNYKLQARMKNHSMDSINVLLPLEKIPKKYFIYKFGHFVSINPKYQDFLYNCNFISKVTPTNSFKFRKVIGEQVLKMRVKKRRFGSVRFYKYDDIDNVGYDKGYNKYKSIKQGKNRKQQLFDDLVRKTEINGKKVKKLTFN